MKDEFNHTLNLKFQKPLSFCPIYFFEYTMFFQSTSVQRLLADPSLIGMKSSTIWTI